MKLGTQMRARNDDDYRIMAQLGVTHVCADPPGNPHDWTVDEIAAQRDRLDRLGLAREGVRDMPRISDARMSGTSYGACILHVSPEPRFARGFGWMAAQHMRQANEGCDFDYLETGFGAAIGEPDIY